MRSTSFISSLAATLILGALGLMTFIDIIDGPGTARQERIARTPDIPSKLGEFPRFLADFRFYVGERYALKERFVTWNGAVKLGVFNQSPVPNVELGTDGFLFLASQGTFEIVQGQSLLKPEEKPLWHETFSNLHAAFEDRNIAYGLVISPNKHTILPEKLPNWVEPVSLEQTRSQNVSDIAQEVFGANFVDQRRFLQASKDEYQAEWLYHPTDTHWTEVGAALAIKQTLAKLGFSLPKPGFEVSQLARSGDLSRMIGQQVSWTATGPELPRTWECSDANGAVIEIITIDPLMPRRISCISENGSGDKLVVFHDSFGVSAIPYLAQNFRNVDFIWSDAADPITAEQLGADVVLHIIVERKLMATDPMDLLLKAQN